jgi:hypothetical protein
VCICPEKDWLFGTHNFRWRGGYWSNKDNNYGALANPKELYWFEGFLGLTGYNRKFVHNYGVLAKPLTILLQQKNFGWYAEAQLAFEALKEAMSSTPVLALPDFDIPFEIEIDASEKVVGAMLSQKGHPIAFFSKALSVANQKLSTYEKEFLAVLMVVEKWRSYISRHPFVIWTDHKSLCHLQDQSLSTEMQRKDTVKLAGLQFKLQCKKGLENKAADVLSRVTHTFALQSSSAVVPVWIQEVLNSYSVDDLA